MKTENSDELLLKQAEEIALKFINLHTSSEATSALITVKIPVYSGSKKAAAKAAAAKQPGLLRAAEGEVSQAEPEQLLLASLPQLGAEGQQQATTQAQASGGQVAPSTLVSGNIIL